MASSTIPTQWLHPEKHPNEWIFRCSTSLNDLAKTHRAAPYFRQLVTFLEHDHQLVDYHLKLRHNLSHDNELNVLIYFGNPNRASNPPPTPLCISCEPTHELSRASLLSEQQYTRAWLDGRAREKLILTPIRHVERLSDLTDEDGEMEAFWQDAVDLINRECGQLEKFYPNMALNHGTYRNHSHLHLKISFTKSYWNKVIVPRHHERITQMKELLKEPDFANDCFGQGHYGKTTQRDKSPKADSHSTWKSKWKS